MGRYNKKRYRRGYKGTKVNVVDIIGGGLIWLVDSVLKVFDKWRGTKPEAPPPVEKPTRKRHRRKSPKNL